MTVPTNSDISKREAKLDKLLKGLNEDGSMPESKLCTQLRTAVRKVWSMHDVKVSYILSKSYPDMNPNTRTKWLVDCEMCGKPMKCNEVEVDHIVGEHSLKSFGDLVPFAQSILGVSHNDLQILCPECHDCKSYSERYGVTLEEAAKRKVVIAKLKQKVPQQKKELQNFGYPSKDISNEAKREACYLELLEGGKI